MGKSQIATTTKELKVIEKDFQKLIASINPKLDSDDNEQIKKAYELAVESHKFQRRKSGEPYIHHPIEVARICYHEIGLGPTAITSAILHDIVEDTDIELEEILELFGPKISKIVDGLTKLDGLYNVESPQAENYKKVLSTLVYDVRVVLIKMADRLHNLRTIGSMPRHKQLKIAAETSYIYAPLAHRLGLYNIKKEFHDIILSIKEPETYQNIAEKLNQSKTERDLYIKEFIGPLKKKIGELDIPYRVLGRPKSISSIYNKIKTKKVSFEEIYDLFAVRIIVDVPEEMEKSICWQVYSMITDVYTPIPERLKDWVTNPKSNGYESLHTTIVGPKGKFVEVQIRSERMDDIAERGFAAHWKYKGKKGRINKINVYDRWLDSIREILDNTTDTLEFISDFKTNLFKEEIYVFTPNGDMKIFPKGATALDFAFDIHTDIGYHAVAIKVNNKLVPMGFKLNNGDKVTVTTSKSQKPNENWLKLVVTGKAKAKIRSAMKDERRKRGEYGKETLERKLKNLKVGYNENIDMLVKFFGFQSRPDLFFAIATEKLDLTKLKSFDIEGRKLISKEEKKKSTSTLLDETLKKTSVKKQSIKQSVYINGEPGSKFNYSFSNCCNPLQGDDIFGFITTGSGLKIHRTTCTNATHLMANYGYRVVQTEWAGNESTEFTAEIRIIGIDTGPGIIQKIIYEITETLGINIRSFNISGEEGYFEGRINIFVRNKNELVVATLRLKKLEGITSVTRVEK